MPNNLSVSDSKYIFNVKTVQCGAIRILVEALKEILTDGNITIEPSGIKLIAMDSTHSVLIHLKLEAENFELYECKMDKIIIGVNMFHLFKLINTIDNDDTLTIYIEEADYMDGIVQFLGLKFENGEIKQHKIQKLRLIEPDNEELDVPDVKFSSVINLPSVDFQKIIRDLSCISDKIEIKSIATNDGAELIFKCTGGFAHAEIRRAETDGAMEFIQKQEVSKIIQGEFSLKNLSYFIKCTNLYNQIEIYLENNLPLIVKYNVASLGVIKLALASLPSS